MRFSIIIPTFNRAELTKKCISIAIVNAGIPFELIWVDNNSTDDVQEVMKRFVPSISILKKKNIGAKSINDALRAATGSFIIILCSDFIMPKNWLVIMRQYLDKIPETGGIGILWRGWEKSGWIGQTKIINGLKVEMANKLMGFIGFTREVFNEVGYLDERLGFYGSVDTDLSNRMLRTRKLFYYIPDLRVIHLEDSKIERVKDINFKIYPDREYKDKACEKNTEILAKKYRADKSIYYTPFEKNGTRKKSYSFAPKELQ